MIERGSEVWAWSQKVWDYLVVGHEIVPCEGILCLWSHDTRVAGHAAQLFHQGYGKWILFSGGFGSGPHSGANLHGWKEPEAEIFAQIAIDAGVPKEKILIEARARNSGENIQFSRELLKEKGLQPSSLIVVQKPFMERRAFATFLKQWEDPKPDILISSPRLTFEDYPTKDLSRETIVNIMVGDLQRIRLYALPPREFQVRQEIPEDVWRACEALIEAGFTWNIIKPGVTDQKNG